MLDEEAPARSQSEAETRSQPHDNAATKRTPIPKFQLFILLLIQFAEPMTALVIYPFVVQFVRDTGITGGDETKTGFYAGLLESSFFLAECLTVYQFGRLSDIYGRRPVLLLAPLGLGTAMLGFGLSKIFWMLLGFRCFQGMFNGSLGVAKTAMNEASAQNAFNRPSFMHTPQISDPTNVADVFSFLQLMWSLGSTTRRVSPFIGGVLANPAVKWPGTLGKIGLLRNHPYFLPCAVAASVAFASFALAFLGLRETLPSAVERPKKAKNTAPTETDPLLPASENAVPAAANPDTVPPLRELLTRNVRIALLNHVLLSFCDMAHDSMVPLVFSTPISLGGLGLEPYDIGLIMGLCGISNAIVQVVLGGWIIRYFGPRRVFIGAFCAFGLIFSAYPLLNILARCAGRVDAAVLVVLVCQLSGSFIVYFSFAATMLFIMDSAPNRASVGSVTGLSQMVGTVARSVAPSIASSLFALSAKTQPRGRVLGVYRARRRSLLRGALLVEASPSSAVGCHGVVRC
ncbi:MFS domain-containing protein [Mycena venus]|uniref:MFS domain-containing protein n=1 Tax=Mycena venus TaxID=2733690 RepID=A0A8H6XAX8_9AGAR|nr:MFS domain-containing protein [Mycena venus]